MTDQTTELTTYQKRQIRLDDLTKRYIEFVNDLEQSDYDTLRETIDILLLFDIDLPEIQELTVNQIGDGGEPVDYTGTDLETLFDLLNDCPTDDMTVELGAGEYRLISCDEVDDIWKTSLIEQLKDTTEVPSHLENYIDWDGYAEDCQVDGMGHHFGTYDGNEYESLNYHIFRTN